MRYNTGMSESSPPSTETAMNETPTPATAQPAAPTPRVPRQPAKGRVFRRTSYARAIIEGVVIFAAFRLLDMVSINTWPGAALIAFFFLLLLLQFSPPVWAAMRVVSTKREKMSGRFWKMGPMLAGLCFLVDLAVTLTLGNAGLFGGPDGNGPVWARLASGAAHPLSWGAFIGNEIGSAAFLLIYFTIAVICTRLANGGFLRFTMPAGNGRVTL
ncbi:MAG TPA: hypothetical protein VKT82_22605 [Ktedonobacterales bacterium]|nr:hypothetical protein [Ktedonobacterales bacterium]